MAGSELVEMVPERIFYFSFYSVACGSAKIASRGVWRVGCMLKIYQGTGRDWKSRTSKGVVKVVWEKGAVDEQSQQIPL